MSDIKFEYLKKLSGLRSIPRGAVMKIAPAVGPCLHLNEYSLTLNPDDQKSWVFDVKVMNLGNESAEIVGTSTPESVSGAIQLTNSDMPIHVGAGESIVLTFEFDKTVLRTEKGEAFLAIEAEGMGLNGFDDTSTPVLEIEYDASIRGGALLSIPQEMQHIDLGRIALYGGHKFSYFAPEGKSVTLNVVERPEITDPVQMEYKAGCYAAMVALTDGVIRYFYDVDGEPLLDPAADRTAVVRPFGQVSEKDLDRLHYTVPAENIGDKVLRLDAHSDECWLSVESSSKTIPPGESTSISLRIAAEHLKKGRNEATLLMSTNAKGRNKNKTVSFVCEGDIQGPHLKIEGESELKFGTVLMGGEHEQSITLLNQGTELLKIELRDPRELIRSRSIEILPGDRHVLQCALDSIDIDEAGDNAWDVLLLSNSSIHPYEVQRVQCGADVITLGLANQIDRRRKVFFTERDTFTVKLKRSDEELIDIKLGDAQADNRLAVKKITNNSFEVTFPGGEDQQDGEFHLKFVDSISRVLKYELRLSYEVITASAELFLKSPRSMRASPDSAVVVGVKNTSDQPLKIFKVSRTSGGGWSYSSAVEAKQTGRQQVVGPGGLLTLTYPLELSMRDRLLSYKKHSDSLSVNVSDRAGTKHTLDLDVVTVPFFSKAKRFVASLIVIMLIAFTAYATYTYGPKRGVVPYPGNIVEQMRGSNCNIEGVETAYQQASILTGNLEDLLAVISCFGTVATSQGWEKIEEIEGNLDTVRVWIKLLNGSLPDSTHNVTATELIDSATPNGIVELPVPQGERESFDEKLVAYLLGGVSDQMGLVDILMRPTKRTSNNDTRSEGIMSSCTHRLNLVEALPGDANVVNGYEEKIDKYEEIIETTAHLEFRNLPSGSKIVVNGEVKVKDTSKGGNRVIVPNNSSVAVQITNRLFYSYSESIKSPQKGTKTIETALKPREGTVNWRPQDSDQPAVESVSLISGGSRRSIRNGLRLPPGDHKIEMAFDNGGVRSYKIEVKSLKTTTVEYECQIGRLRVRTKPTSRIFKIDDGGNLVLVGENGEAFIQDFYGEVRVKCAPMHSIYQDTVITVILNKERQDLNIKLRMK